ncbi:uncharacterized protein LOC132257996 [Phlebotomus argentipes]|uniref:uncharacterized protein LOC132257996 n=1 Tax=Phlebotomus argentipes TaxID=94469 RepID=UPI00289348F2|nr:uncharacterized protein LOC132257996 [Phlebotomus argentipes]
MKPNDFRRRLSRLLFLAVLLLISLPTTQSATINQRKGNATLVLLQDETNATDVRLQFSEFRNIFDIEGHAVNTVDFLPANGLSALMKYLENNNYSTLVFVLSNNNTRDAGYCDMAKQFSLTYNKDVLFWPCPRMKLTENFLPSYEIISFVVKSISQELNWTEAVIFASETNWGLPLAISANIKIPFRVEIGTTNLNERQIADKRGKVVIITSSLNSMETQQVIQHFEHYRLTKLLLIDMFGTIFNSRSHFYTYLGGKFTKMDNIFLAWSSGIVPENANLGENTTRNGSTNGDDSTRPYKNLLVLTVLTEKLRHLLNKTLHVEFEKYSQWMASKTYDDGKSHDISRNATGVKRDRRNLADNTRRYRGKHPGVSGENVAPSDVEGQRDALVSNISGIVLNFLRRVIAFNCDVQSLAANVSVGTPDDWDRLVREQCPREIDCHPEHFDGDTDFCYFFCYHAFGDSTKSMGNSTSDAAGVGGRLREVCFKVKDHKVDAGGAAKRLAEYIIEESQRSGARRWRRQATRDSHPQHQLAYSEFFSLFDFIVTILYGANESGIKFDFIVLDLHQNVNARNESTFGWRPFLILQQNHINHQVFTTHPLLRGFRDWGLDTSQFWTCGTLCWGVIGLAIFLLLCIIVASVTAGIAVRNYLLKKRLSKGPNKIVLSPSDFVFPVDSRRVDEGIEAMLCCWLQQLQEFGGPEVDKPDLLKGSIGSLKNLGLASAAKNNSGSGSLARHHTVIDVRARYNGDLVQLKEIPLMAVTELKTKAMDILMTAHGLRHENINPLIGWLSDANRTAMVFEYCSRGSLQDVLIMDDIKLDWSFRLSLLTDLVRGMRYLHTSALRVHGGLSSRNCVVDARWVLKITDYGLPSFYEAQGIAVPSKSPKELLWTAPEALRGTKGFPKHGTQPADVYSFGIIMQEVVVRGEPYCMLSLSPEDIIAKIKRPPPLIRPSVSKGAAPPEAINIMRQCWAEMPDMRPDFNTVYERFKQLNHGRKVNFVDTMFQMLEKYSNNLEELIRERTEQLDIERKKTEQLLNRMLPSSVAEKLKMGLAVDPEEFSDVTIYFSDIVGFTTIAAHCSPVQVVDLLNDLYTCFDDTINAYDVYKVETIGDAYMVVSGLPGRIPDHAEQIATMALDLLHQSGLFKVKHLPNVPLQLRIGLHTGPCCAGVVGLTMPRYCLFGDTVNTASRMESTGSSWRIHLSQVTRDRLEKAGGYMLEPRGPIEIKGKGLMNTYWLLGKKGFDKPLPSPPPIGEAHGFPIFSFDETLARSMNESVGVLTEVEDNLMTPRTSVDHMAVEIADVKVEITPPVIPDLPAATMSASTSLESSTSGFNLNINIPDFPPKPTTTVSPNQRKMSEFGQDGLLNPSAFNRLSNTSASSARLFKKIEEMMDLSSPYNHYRCLSPSESNLLQCGADLKASFGKFHEANKPGSSRLLRRQFSLDKEDVHGQGGSREGAKHSIDSGDCRSGGQLTKAAMPRIHKQNSNSLAQDLEKIEEIPLSPASSADNKRQSSRRDTAETHADQTEEEKIVGGNGRCEINLNVETLLFR